ncbi:hypothetical protein NDU88_003084 [Pleurodeles waltl]|uniref:Uncharacterized protein n=1 Tax=Pleurodeles waltl TaxID=8319 RepID=A0AAV7UXG4_PLEWA|nr:hypothetical protein NDU88_003084 [Pleurodeles waltl]
MEVRALSKHTRGAKLRGGRRAWPFCRWVHAEPLGGVPRRGRSLVDARGADTLPGCLRACGGTLPLAAARDLQDSLLRPGGRGGLMTDGPTEGHTGPSGTLPWWGPRAEHPHPPSRAHLPDPSITRGREATARHDRWRRRGAPRGGIAPGEAGPLLGVQGLGPPELGDLDE